MNGGYGPTMWERLSAQEREAAALAYFREHGFLGRALGLAGDNEERVRAVVGFAIDRAISAHGVRAAELLAAVQVWPTTAWRHPWLEPGRRLAKTVDALRAVERCGNVDEINFAAEVAASPLRLIDLRCADPHADLERLLTDGEVRR